MEWFGPLFGVVIGATIPAVMSWWQMRSQRKRQLQDQLNKDAELLANIQLLLMDFEPVRAFFYLRELIDGVATSDEIERVKPLMATHWEELASRRDEALRQLLVRSSSHVSRDVRKLAKALVHELYNSFIHTQGRMEHFLKYPEQELTMNGALEQHKKTDGIAEEFEAAIQNAAGLKDLRR